MANRKTEKKLVRVTLCVDPDDYASIINLAKSSDFSASWLILRAIREFLERQQQEKSIYIALENQGTGNSC